MNIEQTLDRKIEMARAMLPPTMHARLAHTVPPPMLSDPDVAGIH